MLKPSKLTKSTTSIPLISAPPTTATKSMQSDSLDGLNLGAPMQQVNSSEIARVESSALATDSSSYSSDGISLFILLCGCE